MTNTAEILIAQDMFNLEAYANRHAEIKQHLSSYQEFITFLSSQKNIAVIAPHLHFSNLSPTENKQLEALFQKLKKQNEEKRKKVEVSSSRSVSKTEEKDEEKKRVASAPIERTALEARERISNTYYTRLKNLDSTLSGFVSLLKNKDPQQFLEFMQKMFKAKIDKKKSPLEYAALLDLRQYLIKKINDQRLHDAKEYGRDYHGSRLSGGSREHLIALRILATDMQQLMEARDKIRHFHQLSITSSIFSSSSSAERAREEEAKDYFSHLEGQIKLVQEEFLSQVNAFTQNGFNSEEALMHLIRTLFLAPEELQQPSFLSKISKSSKNAFQAYFFDNSSTVLRKYNELFQQFEGIFKTLVSEGQEPKVKDFADRQAFAKYMHGKIEEMAKDNNVNARAINGKLSDGSLSQAELSVAFELYRMELRRQLREPREQIKKEYNAAVQRIQELEIEMIHRVVNAQVTDQQRVREIIHYLAEISKIFHNYSELLEKIGDLPVEKPRLTSNLLSSAVRHAADPRVRAIFTSIIRNSTSGDMSQEQLEKTGISGNVFFALGFYSEKARVAMLIPSAGKSKLEREVTPAVREELGLPREKSTEEIKHDLEIIETQILKSVAEQKELSDQVHIIIQGLLAISGVYAQTPRIDHVDSYLLLEQMLKNSDALLLKIFASLGQVFDKYMSKVTPEVQEKLSKLQYVFIRLGFTDSVFYQALTSIHFEHKDEKLASNEQLEKTVVTELGITVMEKKERVTSPEIKRVFT